MALNLDNYLGKDKWGNHWYAKNNYYEQTQSDEIGEILGSLQLLEDGKPADPAMWEDWLESIEKINLEITKT